MSKKHFQLRSPSPISEPLAKSAYLLCLISIRNRLAAIYKEQAQSLMNMHFQEETLDDALHAVLTAVLAKGTKVSASKGNNVELTGVLVEISNPRARLSLTETRGRPFSCLGELLWYLAGSDRLDFIEYYIPLYRKFAEANGTIHGAYGPRIFSRHGTSQFESVFQLLTKKRDTRQAVIQIFSGDDIVAQKKDTPCTCTLQFLIRDGRLQLIACMRSNDAYHGFPHDVFAFTMLQEIMAANLGIDVGQYVHFAGSMHIYDAQMRDAQQFIDEGFQSKLSAMPAMPIENTRQAIASLLLIEEKLRTVANTLLGLDELHNLPEYWQDIARLLIVYRCQKNGDINGLQNTLRELRSPVYSTFVDRKIARLQDRACS